MYQHHCLMLVLPLVLVKQCHVKPRCISDSAENDQWINNKVNGFLFSIKNSEQLAEILIKLIKDEPLRKTVGKEGRNIIIKK